MTLRNIISPCKNRLRRAAAFRRGQVSLSAFCFLLSVFCLVPGTQAQDLVKDALTTFSPYTIHLEYSRPVKLRTLPNYESLRQRYVAPNLRTLEASLSKLGIEENDVDELVLGWQPAAEGMDLQGLAAGRFNPTVMAQRAAAQDLTPVPVAGLKAYCLGPEAASTCVAAWSETRGAFGPLASLTAMLEARNGHAPSLGSVSRFITLVNNAHTKAPIWGVAVGQAVPDWFKAWLTAQKGVEMDWSKMFETVESLSYSVETSDKVRLNAKLDCASPESAASLRQIFQGLKLFQQLAWQNQNPNRPNPFEALVVDATGRQVSLALTTAYAALEGGGPPSTP